MTPELNCKMEKAVFISKCDCIHSGNKVPRVYQECVGVHSGFAFSSLIFSCSYFPEPNPWSDTWAPRASSTLPLDHSVFYRHAKSDNMGPYCPSIFLGASQTPGPRDPPASASLWSVVTGLRSISKWV